MNVSIDEPNENLRKIKSSNDGSSLNQSSVTKSQRSNIDTSFAEKDNKMKDTSKGSTKKDKPSSDTGRKSIQRSSLGLVGAKKHEKSTKIDADEARNNSVEAGISNPDLGPFLLKQARDAMSSGEHPDKVLHIALRAAKSFENSAGGRPTLDLVLALHLIASLHCSSKQYDEAISMLKHSVNIVVPEQGHDHSLAQFSGYMQLGDIYAILGQIDCSLECYVKGLEVQKKALGQNDPRVGETCRYLAEAYLQAVQFEEAERLCKMALDIHKQKGDLASLEEAADRRLMALICDTKGDYETALEHLVRASMAMMSNGQEAEVASVDCCIGDTYLALGRYDEAVFAYHKALNVFKFTKGENHQSVASVFVRLADLYNRIGKFGDSRIYCEHALQIYKKPLSGASLEEIASGFADIAAIYESMNELEHALKLLQKALKIYNDATGRPSTIAGIEAQIGVLYYISGNYYESYSFFRNAIEKFRACGEIKPGFLATALNQMGLACVHLNKISEATELFKEAKITMEEEYGQYHPDTLGVCSNLAGAYDAMGRLNEAIEMLEYVVGIREELLGTANPDVITEKKRLAVLLKEAGRVRHRKTMSLEDLLHSHSLVTEKSLTVSRSL
ncbi:Nephrocystin-3 [Ananas comosus]|nr:Nephrocystin-3 [Ananas comosus]